MKTYREMADSVLSRGREILEKRAKRKKVILKTAAAASCCCLVALAGFGLYRGGAFGQPRPQVDAQKEPGAQTKIEQNGPDAQTKIEQNGPDAQRSSGSDRGGVPIIWAKDGAAVTNDCCLIWWQGKLISGSLMQAIQDGKGKPVSAFAIRATYRGMEPQFVYEGKTVAQYEELLAEKELLCGKYGGLLKDGDELKRGEALYTTPGPDGTKWAKSLYDQTVAHYGKEFLSRYLVGGEFLREKCEADDAAAQREYEEAEKTLSAACAAYQRGKIEKSLAQLRGQNIPCELKNGALTLFATEKQLAELTLDDLPNWFFSLASRSETEPEDAAAGAVQTDICA